MSKYFDDLETRDPEVRERARESAPNARLGRLDERVGERRRRGAPVVRRQRGGEIVPHLG